MISILLSILKIIGIILLVILCIVLFIIGVLLFVPVRYRGNGSRYGKLKGRVKVTWLLHILSVTASYEEDFSLKIRIFGFPLGGKASEEEDGESKEPVDEDEFWEQVSKELDQREFPEDEPSAMQPVSDDKEKAPVPDVHIASIDDESGDFEYHAESLSADNKDAKSKLSGILSRIGAFFTRLMRKLYQGIVALIKKLQAATKRLWSAWNACTDRVGKIRKFVTDQENRKLFFLLLRQTKKLLGHVLPRKIKGKLTIGFEDPYTTGQALAAAGFLCPIYKSSLEIIPSFEEPVFEGELDFSGRIRLAGLIFIIGKLFLNKRFRFLLRKYMK